MSLHSLFNTANEDHGGPLYFHRDLGAVPVRGRSAPLLRPEEMDQVRQHLVACVRVFDLSKDEDLKAYRQVLERAANQWYIIGYQERHFEQQTKSMLVYLEWYQRYNDVPAHLASLANHQGNGNV